MTKFRLNVQGEVTELEGTRRGDVLQVTHNGQTAELRLIHQEGNRFVLEYRLPNGACQLLHLAGQSVGDRRQVLVNGRHLAYNRVQTKAGQAAENSGASLSSSIPAVVSQVLVQVGDSVAAGDKLILLESMKMVIPIHAPHDGKITQLNCTAGQAVQPGVPLLELEALQEA